MGSHSRDVAVAQASTQLDVNISGSFKIVNCQLKTKASGQQHCFYFPHITPIMTFWADNIKFIKDIQDSKYKKIEDCIAELNEQIATLTTDKDDKKAREHFVEASRTLEIMNMGEIDPWRRPRSRTSRTTPRRRRQRWRGWRRSRKPMPRLSPPSKTPSQSSASEQPPYQLDCHRKWPGSYMHSRLYIKTNLLTDKRLYSRGGQNGTH